MVKIGIAGMGYAGRIHYEAARMVPGVQVVAAASTQNASIRELFPELEITSSWQELLRDSRLDAVIICVPTFLHESLVIEAAAHGRHILCEKPMALNPSSALRMLKAVQDAGVVFTVAQVLRFWPQYARIRQLIKEGILGQIRSASAYRLAKQPEWSAWFSDPGKSGGCLLDMQVHDLDFIFWTLGRPLQIQSFGIKSTPGSWDHVHTILTYANGAIASIESSYLMPRSWPLTAGIRVVGSAASIEYAFRSGGDIAGRSESNGQAILYGLNGGMQELAVDREDMFVAQLRHFAECIENRMTPMICPREESREVMTLLGASRQSADTGKPVHL
jgi:predicted dehydrogenase